jgi:hypothetical protein
MRRIHDRGDEIAVSLYAWRMAAERNTEGARGDVGRQLETFYAMTRMALEREKRFAPPLHVTERKVDQQCRVGRACRQSHDGHDRHGQSLEADDSFCSASMLFPMNTHVDPPRDVRH